VLDEGLDKICAALQPGAKVRGGVGLAGFGQQAAVGPDLLRSGAAGTRWSMKTRSRC